MSRSDRKPPEPRGVAPGSRSVLGWLLALLAAGGCGEDAGQVPPAGRGGGVLDGGAASAAKSLQSLYTAGEQAKARQLPDQLPDQAEDPVEGVVIGPDGEPVTDARVTLFRRLREWPRRDRDELHSVRSGAGGRFVFDVTRARDLEVEVRAQRCAMLIQPVPSRGEGPMDLRLRRGFAVSGRVLLPNGRPAARCAVFLEPGAGSQMRAVDGRTDEFGEFRFEHVPAENLRISARHDQYRPVTSDTVTIGRPTVLKFTEGGLALSGTVVSAETGKKLEGSRVLVSPRTANGMLYAPFEATADAEGAFTIRGLGTGSYQVEVRHENHSSTQRSVSLNGSRTGLSLDLQPPVAVTGRLVGATGFEPLAITVVSYYGEAATAQVQADGSFAFATSLSRGLATFELAPGPYSFKSSRSRWIRRALVETDRAFELEVEPASTVAGSVQDPEGKPLAGVRVVAALKVIDDPWNLFGNAGLLTANDRTLALTDAEGRYEIRGLEPGEVNLRFQKQGFAYFQRAVTVVPDAAAASREPPVLLQRPGTISGRVTRGQRPVSGALVTAGPGLAPVFTGPRGRYVLQGLPPGEHLIRVKYRTLRIAHSDRLIQLVAGQEVTGVDVELPMGRRLQGRVVDSEEIPMANVTVESTGGTSTKSDESGKFSLDVPFGPTELFLRATPNDPVYDRILVEAGAQELLVRMQLAPRASVTAEVLTMPRQLPVVGLILRLDNAMEVAFHAVSPGSQWAQTLQSMVRLQRLEEHHRRGYVERWIETPDGILEQHDLPAGNYVLTLHAKGYQPFKKEVLLLNGKSLNLGEVRLEPGFKVHGIVLNRAGRPVSGARIVLGRESDLTLAGARTRYLSDDSGRFTVEGVGLDQRMLFVAAKGYATQGKRIDLEKDILRTGKNPIQVIMRPGATIKAWLFDHRGEPMPFKRVQINREFQHIGEVETDEHGIAWFHNLASGSYHLYTQSDRVRTMRNMVIRDTGGAKVYEVKLKQPRPRR